MKILLIATIIPILVYMLQELSLVNLLILSLATHCLMLQLGQLLCRLLLPTCNSVIVDSKYLVCC